MCTQGRVGARPPGFPWHGAPGPQHLSIVSPALGDRPDPTDVHVNWPRLPPFRLLHRPHQGTLSFLFSYVRHVGDAFDVEKVTSRLLQIRTGRGKSLESLEDPTERTHHTFSTENTHTTFHYNQPQVGWRPRSYDDGDITPTNETGLFYEGGGTLPRPRGIIRPRQIAKITAKVR